MFNHIDLNLEPLKRETIDGVRYYSIPDYSIPDVDRLVKLVSITSVTSHFNREIFILFIDDIALSCLLLSTNTCPAICIAQPKNGIHFNSIFEIGTIQNGIKPSISGISRLEE